MENIITLLGLLVCRHDAGETLELKGTWKNLHCLVRGGRSSTLKTDGEPHIEGSYIRGSGYYAEQAWSATLTTASYAVVVGEDSDADGNVFRNIREIHVWPNANEEIVAGVAACWIFGKGATLDFLKARKLGKTNNWAAASISPGHDAGHVVVGGEEFEVFLDLGQVRLRRSANADFEYAATRVFNHLEDNDLALEMLPWKQRLYADTLLK